MSDYYEDSSVLEQLYAEGLIENVCYRIKSGKEATVYCCQAAPLYGDGLVSAKVYKPVRDRGFKRANVYLKGRVTLDKREGRAIKNKSEFGREAQLATWVGQEYETMQGLYEAGADIPRPVRCTGRALLMEHIGCADSAAPQLKDVALEREEAERLYWRLMDNIELMLSQNCIHADLSAYNVLYWEGNIKLIDFPQAIDPRFNREAETILLRDMGNLQHHFLRYGIDDDVETRGRRLWRQFVSGRL
ncbi:MAG: hypothetical protein PHW04_09365 [Candidatus Wallbacteria bacterium]|nr:hypothetical protein [Candidatus Wallbacteria bacterium]